MLKGHVKLDLCDAITGRVKERVEGDNTITGAIDSLLNRCPMGADRRWLDGRVEATSPASEAMLDLAHTALGGVLLFPEEVGNGLYEPMTHLPTAYARYGAQDSTDLHTGVWTNESIPLANGYRFAYEWGASYGTFNDGKISTVCLTHKYGGEAYGSKTYWGDKWRFDLPILEGYDNSITPLGFWGGYYYFVNRTDNLSSGRKIMKIKRPLNEILINQLPMSGNPDTAIGNISPIDVWTSDTAGARPCLDSEAGKIYIVKGADSSNKTMVTIDLTDDSTTSTTLANTSGKFKGKTGSYYLIVKRGDYIYSVESENSSSSGGTATIGVYNLNNGQWGEIPITSGAYSSCQMFLMTDTNEINGGGFIIDEEDGVHYTTGANAIMTMDRIGVWQGVKSIGSTGLGPRPIGFQVNPYYMASKFVLSEPVRKTTALTMKLIYEVIHV